MNKKLRYRIFEKISQTVTPTDLPTQGVTNIKTVSGSPPSFVATDYYPGIIIAFSTKNAPIINKLSDILNQALYYTSDGKVNLSWMRSVNFNFDTDVPSIDLKNLMNFSKQIYNKIYTNNSKEDKIPLKPDEISERITPLKSSSFISNLSSTNPMGQLSSKIGGNIKTLINNYLLQII